MSRPCSASRASATAKISIWFDRLGLEEHYIEYLGNRVVCHRIPIRPGRNLAIICEAAAVNHRQKLMGYNAAQELYKRVQANLMGGNRNDEDD